MKKRALVIGGSGGIGSEVVRSLAHAGMCVYGTYHKRRPPRFLDIREENQPIFYQMDVIDEESVRDTIQQASKEAGNFDCVVFAPSAAIVGKPLIKMEVSDLEDHLSVQLKGMVSVVRALQRQILKKHRTKFIVVLTEYCIGKPPVHVSHYISAKYALLGFSKCMAVELSKYNCTTNMISPGMTETGLLSHLPAKLLEITAKNNPLGRLGKPKDVAGLVVFLSSEEAEYLNGVHITVNGGGVMI